MTRTRRGLVSELELTRADDDVPTDCIVNFDNLHTIPRAAFRRRVTTLAAPSGGGLPDAAGRARLLTAGRERRQLPPRRSVEAADAR